MKNARPAAMAALVASFRRGHSKAAVMLPATVRHSLRTREGWPPASCSFVFVIPAHPRRAALLRQLDEPRSMASGGCASLPYRGGEALRPPVGAAFLTPPGHVAEADPVAGIGETQGGVGTLMAEGEMAAEIA